MVRVRGFIPQGVSGSSDERLVTLQNSGAAVPSSTAGSLREARRFRVAAARSIASQMLAINSATDTSAAAVSVFRSISAAGFDPNAQAFARKSASASIGDGSRFGAPSRKSLDAAAAFITHALLATGAASNRRECFASVLSDLRAGIFSSEIWAACPIAEHSFFSCTPEISDDTHATPRAYDDENNRRSVSAFPLGTPSAGPARYAGRTIAGRFEDTNLTWENFVFGLPAPFEAASFAPLFVSIDAHIKASANRRGSGAMLSFLVRAALGDLDTARAHGFTPPTNRAWSIYYPYKAPNISPPWQASHDYPAFIRSLRFPRSEQEGQTFTHAALSISPRPMYGRSFANNYEVFSSLHSSVTLWQVKPELMAREWTFSNTV